MNKTPIELILVAPDPALDRAFRSRFDYLPNVTFANCEFERLSSYDCLVSPANSFGMMDGGMDAAITAFFGMQLMERVQQQILDDYLGEQSVGTSFIIATGHPHCLIAVKQNQPTLDRAIESTAQTQLPVSHVSMFDASHGRTVERSVSVFTAPAQLFTKWIGCLVDRIVEFICIYGSRSPQRRPIAFSSCSSKNSMTTKTSDILVTFA
jgi:hypothetical protein